MLSILATLVTCLSLCALICKTNPAVRYFVEIVPFRLRGNDDLGLFVCTPILIKSPLLHVCSAHSHHSAALVAISWIYLFMHTDCLSEEGNAGEAETSFTQFLLSQKNRDRYLNRRFRPATKHDKSSFRLPVLSSHSLTVA
ncbi:hypothetical protein BKA59DRAFT_479859 [Fusarium tricinctum]|uniref:Secreted protein n=1 Tax=Fusarium tricinctum TaxID=61284 RepID=A0A8K0RVU4_9HYPO|nr:hypothetical protein BKA59DRAFT_479859 [Fusarium tricinctum]